MLKLRALVLLVVLVTMGLTAGAQINPVGFVICPEGQKMRVTARLLDADDPTPLLDTDWLTWEGQWGRTGDAYVPSEFWGCCDDVFDRATFTFWYWPGGIPSTQFDMILRPIGCETQYTAFYDCPNELSAPLAPFFIVWAMNLDAAQPMLQLQESVIEATGPAHYVGSCTSTPCTINIGADPLTSLLAKTELAAVPDKVFLGWYYRGAIIESPTLTILQTNSMADGAIALYGTKPNSQIHFCGPDCQDPQYAGPFIPPEWLRPPPCIWPDSCWPPRPPWPPDPPIKEGMFDIGYQPVIIPDLLQLPVEAAKIKPGVVPGIRIDFADAAIYEIVMVHKPSGGICARAEVTKQGAAVLEMSPASVGRLGLSNVAIVIMPTEKSWEKGWTRVKFKTTLTGI